MQGTLMNWVANTRCCGDLRQVDRIQARTMIHSVDLAVPRFVAHA